MYSFDVCVLSGSVSVDVETLWTIAPPPGSSVLGIFQAKILNWVVISFSSNFDSLLKKKKKKVISLIDFKYRVILLILYKQIVKELLLQPEQFQEDFSLHS